MNSAEVRSSDGPLLASEVPGNPWERRREIGWIKGYGLCVWKFIWHPFLTAESTSDRESITEALRFALVSTVLAWLLLLAEFSMAVLPYSATTHAPPSFLAKEIAFLGLVTAVIPVGMLLLSFLNALGAHLWTVITRRLPPSEHRLRRTLVAYLYSQGAVAFLQVSPLNAVCIVLQFLLPIAGLSRFHAIRPRDAAASAIVGPLALFVLPMALIVWFLQ